MKKYIILSLALFAHSVIIAQQLEWAYSFKNPQVLENLTDVSANGSNRFAIVGGGNSGISMDPIGLLPSYNSTGNFVASYNENAQVQWVYPTVGNAFAVKVSATGDVFVSGAFTGTQNFDVTGGSSPLTAGGYDTYLQKFNSAGQFQWAAKATAEGTPSKIEILADGRIVVAGRSDVDAVATLSNNTTVNLSKGAYILEFSATGQFTNAISFSAPNPVAYVYVNDIKSDANNNLIIGGHLDGVANFNTTGGSSTNPLTNGYDAFVVKLNSSLGLEWFRVFGDSNTPQGWDKARTIATDAQGNIFVGGEFTWVTDFDRENPGTVTLQSDDNAQTPSAFLLQYSPSGSLNWVKKIGNTNLNNTNEDFANLSLQAIRLGGTELYALFEGNGNVDVDPGAATTFLSVGAIASPGLLFGKYSLSGDYATAFKVDTSSGGGVVSVGMDILGTGNVVVAGTFNRKINFSPSGNPFYLQTDVNGFAYDFDKDLYIAKYSFGPQTAIADAAEASINSSVYPNPASGLITVKNTNAKDPISIYTSQGQLVAKLFPQAGHYDISNLSAGLYSIRIANEYFTLVKE